MALTNITLVWPAQSNLPTTFLCDPILQFYYPSFCDFASRLTWGVKPGSGVPGGGSGVQTPPPEIPKALQKIVPTSTG